MPVTLQLPQKAAATENPLILESFQRIQDVVNYSIQAPTILGTPVNATDTITVNGAITHVRGTAIIRKINAPNFFSTIFLIADDSFSLSRMRTTWGGNIASDMYVAQYNAVQLFWDQEQSVWYPVSAGQALRLGTASETYLQALQGSSGSTKPPGNLIYAVVDSTESPAFGTNALLFTGTGNVGARFRGNQSGAASLTLEVSGGPITAPAGVGAGVTVGQILFTARDATNLGFPNGATIEAVTTEATTAAATGMKISFKVATTGTAGTNEKSGVSGTGKVFYNRQNVTLANGNNDDIAITTSFMRIIGPTGAFATRGFAVGNDGDILVVLNDTLQTWTISNENAGSTAANRIRTLTGADVVMRAGARTAATFIYETANNRWNLISYN